MFICGGLNMPISVTGLPHDMTGEKQNDTRHYF